LQKARAKGIKIRTISKSKGKKRIKTKPMGARVK
jgi:hypothetical protein